VSGETTPRCSAERAADELVRAQARLVRARALAIEAEVDRRRRPRARDVTLAALLDLLALAVLLAVLLR
jgi:hypothetical protein